MRRNRKPIGTRSASDAPRTSSLGVSAFLCFCVSAFAQSGGGYELTWSTIDSGGVMRSTGGDLELSGTIGQPDAGAMSGGGYNLTGGFWFEIPVGDCDYDGVVGRGDIRSFTDCADGPGSPFAPAECVCSDFDGDGDIDLRDFAGLQIEFAGQ